jgi:hypothetical protein
MKKAIGTIEDLGVKDESGVIEIKYPVLLNEKEYDGIKLIDEGALLVNSNAGTITINKLINAKKLCYPETDPEIHVFCNDGDKPLEAGENGTDAQLPATLLRLNIKDLSGEIYAGSSGGNGGDGAYGESGEYSGGKGGNGGNGSDATPVFISYGSSEKDGNIKFAFSRGGLGGYGGNGGEPINKNGSGGEPGETGKSGEIGKSGKPGKPGTKGGSYGSGGDGGKSGGGSKITVLHPLYSVSVNGKEIIPAGKLPKFDFGGARVNYADPEHLKYWIFTLGGFPKLSETPERFNHVLRIIENAQNFKNTVGADESAFVTVHIEDITLNDYSESEKRNGNESSTIYVSLRQTSTYADYPLESYKNDGTGIPSSKLSGGQSVIYLLDYTDVSTGGLPELLYETSRQFDGDLPQQDLDLQHSFQKYDIAGRTIKYSVSTTFFTDKGAVTSDPAVKELPPVKSGEVVNALDFIKYVEVTDPHWNPNVTHGTNDPVAFLYGRDTGRYPEGDYFDGDYGNNAYNSQAGILHTIIPISGKVYLKPPTAMVDYKSVRLLPFIDGGFTVPRPSLIYHLPDADVYVKFHKDISDDNLAAKLSLLSEIKLDTDADDNHFISFKLMMDVGTGRSKFDWDADFPSVILKNDVHLCDLRGTFRLNLEYINGDTLYNAPYSITIKSIDSLKDHDQKEWFKSDIGGANTQRVYIPEIEIQWGCFSADAKIKVVNGIKRADEINVGDKVETYSGEILTVHNIITGTDEMIYCIVTESGMVTKVSAGHAMKLYSSDNPDGVKIAAGNIKPGDVLMTPNGNVTVKHCDEVPYGNTVYNFTFAERQTAQYIEADGFWSGDFHAQNNG